MSKGPDFPGVVAEKIVDFIPFLQEAPSVIQQVISDDNLDQELGKKLENNDFVMRQFTDHEDEGHKKYALYKHNHTLPLLTT